MAKAKQEIDLSGTNFDALETDLSKQLGLKVILVRGWQGAAALDQAGAEMQLARTQEAWETARDNYNLAKESMLASLRSSIADRDPATASDMSETELFALKAGGHVTLRKSNVERESAVIIFDPVSTPRKSVAILSFSDADGNNRQTISLTEGGTAAEPELPKEMALYMALSPTFQNQWMQSSEDRNERQILVEDFAENFDIDIQDLRRYKALVNVRYALRHQTEYVNQFDREQPDFVQFANLQTNEMEYLDKPYYKRWYRDVFNEVASIEGRYEAAKKYGMKDPEFFEKLKLAGAVMNLALTNLTPNNTFARLKGINRVDEKVDEKFIDNTMRSLHRRIEENIQKKFPDAFEFSVMQDWRILFPIFREVYEADTSKGVEREYLDTIMQGLQKWFPTITNGPVPADLRANEPPRTLSGYKSAPPNPAQPKSEPKKAAKRRPSKKPHET